MYNRDFGQWYPRDHEYGPIEPGVIVAYNFKPWRIIDIREGVEHPDHPGATYTVYRMRPLDAGDCADRDEHRGWTRSWNGPKRLAEHYGLCVHCGELLPCRAVMAKRASDAAGKRMARYETPGVCPHCQEIVTHRQERETFPNIVVPLGPPVTFHAGRRACRRAMEKYRDEVGQPDMQLRTDGGGDG